MSNTTYDGPDRRDNRRIPLRMLVQVRLADKDEFMDDYAANISVGGMFIRTERPHRMGDRVYLQFHTADGGKLIEGLGKVVHVNPKDHENPGMGIEFVNLDPESEQLINEILEQRA